MAALIRAIQSTQTIGLTVTGAALAYYYFAPDLSVIEAVEVPPISLFAGVRRPSASGLQEEQVSRDCYCWHVPLQDLPPPITKGADTAVDEYARTTFLSTPFTAERLILRYAAGLGDGLDGRTIAKTHFDVGYKMGPFRVVERAPGEILFHWALPSSNMAGATWLAVRMPHDTPSPASFPADSAPDAQTRTANSIGSEAGLKEVSLGYGEGAGKGLSAGDVDFLFGSAVWEVDGTGRDMMSGVLGALQRTYSRILLYSGVRGLQARKP